MMKTNSPPYDLIPEETMEGPQALPMSNETPESKAIGAGSMGHSAHDTGLIMDQSQRNMLMMAAAAAAAQSQPVFPDMNSFLQAQLIQQMKTNPFIQRQILEQQINRNREILKNDAVQMHQPHMKKSEMSHLEHEPMKEGSRGEKLHLEILKQKSRQEQSAVASPEVKRHLQEFVLQKKRKEAAASMGNLKLVPQALPPSQPILRKTASESNLLKMKNKRNSTDSRLGATPYQRHHPSIPETTVLSGQTSANSSPPVELNSPSNSSTGSCPGDKMGSIPQEHILRSATASLVASSQASGSSEPSSPNAGTVHNLPFLKGPCTQASLVGASLLNSKSLPNIPSAVGRFSAAKEGHYKRKSPPPCSSMKPTPHHGAMIVRRSKSSAILPLRKHLIEKSMSEKTKSMDEEQFYYQQKQMARDRLTIRPIVEVMEEECKPGDAMDVDGEVVQTNQRPPHYITTRLGPSGLSPLVLSEVRNDSSSMNNEFVTRLLPRQPLDLAVSSQPIHTGIGYDPSMLRHHCICKNSSNHPENPDRLLCIWRHLVESGIAERCVRVAREATLEEIQSCHSEAHTLLYGTDMINRCSLTGSQEFNRDSRLGKFCGLDCGGMGVDGDTYWNEVETPSAVRTAVGSVVELSQKVARGELRNGYALVRPPGHHAELDEAMGFCYFNSVGIAAKQVLRLPTVKRVLVFDWAIHHGNGTQKAFYDDPNVLYISIHRHDNGNFYPGTGGPVECGTGPGLGFNVNIAWTGGLDPPMGDAEYLAAFRSIIFPIARSYDPDIVIVSAGFDAAIGHPHPIGGYMVSTACFAYMAQELKKLAGGRLVLALEGGFNLDILVGASEQCIRALLGLPIVKIDTSELARRPCTPAMETLQKTLAIQTPYWEVLRRHSETAFLSHLEAWEKSREENEALNAMAHISLESHTPSTSSSSLHHSSHPHNLSMGSASFQSASLLEAATTSA
ncbi:histone deacetylase 4-like isoform X1 [Tigriopus californicus]|uniref:histone deacetylase 4-like isoform X1 n=1 Tax=Tigriopus californicus TaxID=6832 RepID=UPI0027D9ED23|nr:histone deacetylase 4-like isoform X1 [Tigriopus californicus]